MLPFNPSLKGKATKTALFRAIKSNVAESDENGDSKSTLLPEGAQGKGTINDLLEDQHV